MATLSVTRAYADGDILLESDLDAFLDDIETFLNSTKVNDDNIQAGGITGSTKLANASVTNSKMAADAIGTTQIVNDAVTTAKIATGAVTPDEIAADAVTTVKILDDNVTSGKILADAVTTAKILDANVTADKLASNSVTTGKIEDAAVSRNKLAAVGQQESSSSGGFTTNSATLTDVTNLSVSITTIGRPVIIMVKVDASTNTNKGLYLATGTNMYVVTVLRGATQIYYKAFDYTDTSEGFTFMEVPGAGTYTYKVQVKSNGTDNVGAGYMILGVYEL